MTSNQDDSQEEHSSFNNTRRQFVAGSAGALGGIAAGSAFVGPAFGQEDEEEEEEEPEEEEEEEEEEEPEEDEFEDDVDILNYALTLEYLEAAFYRQGLENLSEEDFCNCRALQENTHLQEVVYEELQTIQAHEEAHAQAISQTIEDIGGEPIEEPEFNFGIRVEYPMAFLATAALLEDLGVAAYAGAAPSVENEDILAAALGIHSVEARHAAFVRTLGGQTSFPEVIDEAAARADVEELANAFIEGEDGDPDDIDDGEPEEPDEDEDDEEEMPDDEDDEDDEDEDDEDENDENDS